MPIDPTKRVANYTRKTPATRTAGIVTARITGMQNNFAAVTPDLVAMEQQVRQVLNGAGQATIQYPFYLCFGRELWALKRRGIAGESLAIEAATLIAKWVAQGLTSAVLQGIRTDVFDIAAPLGP